MDLIAIEKLLTRAYIEIEIVRRQLKRFNVFDVAGVGHYETTHSSILAGILAYDGCNYAPLRSFLKICNQNGKCPINLDDKKIASEQVSVSTETTIQVNEETRRLDILVRIGRKLCLVIENKIYTTDHSDQLQAYSDWLNKQRYDNAFLIYLTLEGNASTDGCPPEKYIPLSYRKNIRDFLSSCCALSNVDFRFNSTVLQYNEFWENWFMQSNELNTKIQEQILESKGNFEAAQEVVNTFENAKATMIKRLLSEWQNTKLKEFKVVSDANSLTGKSWDKILFMWNSRYTFGFEFENNFCNLYYGIVRDPHEKNSTEIDDWKHTPAWFAWKYVQDNAIRNLGANASMCFSDKERIFEVLDAAFDEVLSLLNGKPDIFGSKS